MNGCGEFVGVGGDDAKALEPIFGRGVFPCVPDSAKGKWLIARQRPGTAKGFIFLSMEDETGIANVIVTPDLYERERVTVVRSKFLLAEGVLQNQDVVIHVKATRLS